MKRWVRPLGLAIGLTAGAFFLAYAYRALHDQDLRQILQPQVAFSVAVLTFLYMALIPVTSIAWVALLRGLGRPTTLAVATPILAASQFGKYLPGNIGHHVGRVVMARSAGIGAGIAATSIVYESLLTLLACSHISALTLIWDAPRVLDTQFSQSDRMMLVLLVSAAAILLLAIAPHGARMIWRIRNGNADIPPPAQFSPGFTPLVLGYLCFAANFALVGLGLWITASALTPADAPGISLALMIGAFASSWIIGFLTPGAPAGLGVRELVLAFWLADAMPASAAVTLILALRIATTLGDLANFAWGLLALRLQRNRRREASIM